MLRRAELGTSLSLRELLDVASVLRAVRTLYDWRRHCDEVSTSLDYMFSGLSPQRHLEDSITAAIVSEEMVDDHASAELANIRRKIEINPAAPEYLRTEIGVGYWMPEGEWNGARFRGRFGKTDRRDAFFDFNQERGK